MDAFNKATRLLACALFAASFGAEDLPPALSRKNAMRHPKARPSPSPSSQPVEETTQPQILDGFISQLLPTLNAGEKFIKAAIKKSGLDEEMADILAALNETSRNPLFLLGLDQPVDRGSSSQSGAWLTDKKPVAASSTQRRDDEVLLTSKNLFSSLLSSFSSWPTDIQAKLPATWLQGGNAVARQQIQQERNPHAQSPGVAPDQRGALQQEGLEDDTPPLRKWHVEDLDLM